MRAIAIFGPGSHEKELEAFQRVADVSWQFDLSVSIADAVVIFGGDGTIHRCLRQLVNLQVPLLVVPRGSGNDFARALGLYRWRDSIAAWKRFIAGTANTWAIDLGVIDSLIQKSGSTAAHDTPETHYFCTIAGIGLDGEVIQRVNRLPRWFRGNGGYALTLPPALFRFAAVPVKISPHVPIHNQIEYGFHPTFLAAFANAPAYGGGMKIAPKAELNDGQLDICIIRDINKLKLLSVFPSVYFGRHLGIAGVEYLKTQRARVETPQPFDVYADGEYVCQTPVEISVKKAALRVIIPCKQSPCD
jgi:YegS/Rv2252/BmrU family lipid kinase